MIELGHLVAVPFSQIEPGERFMIFHIPEGMEQKIENAIGPPCILCIRGGDSDGFDARTCRQADWQPIGTMDFTGTEVRTFFLVSKRP
jgi:hypothetical protein